MALFERPVQGPFSSGLAGAEGPARDREARPLTARGAAVEEATVEANGSLAKTAKGPFRGASQSVFPGSARGAVRGPAFSREPPPALPRGPSKGSAPCRKPVREALSKGPLHETAQGAFSRRIFEGISHAPLQEAAPMKEALRGTASRARARARGTSRRWPRPRAGSPVRGAPRGEPRARSPARGAPRGECPVEPPPAPSLLETDRSATPRWTLQMDFPEGPSRGAVVQRETFQGAVWMDRPEGPSGPSRGAVQRDHPVSRGPVQRDPPRGRAFGLANGRQRGRRPEIDRNRVQEPSKEASQATRGLASGRQRGLCRGPSRKLFKDPRGTVERDRLGGPPRGTVSNTNNSQHMPTHAEEAGTAPGGREAAGFRVRSSKERQARDDADRVWEITAVAT